MATSLTVGMKATIGLILAFLIFLVAGGVGTLLLGPWDIYLALSIVIFVPLLLVLLFFTWKGKAWAYGATMVLGVFFTVASVPIGFPEPAPPLLLWETMLATVLGLLMALEGFKAYSELRAPKA